MRDADWLPHAQALHEGGSKKIGHDCGAGDCLQLNHKREGWAAYCYRCGYKEWIARPAESLAEKLARLRVVQATEQAAVSSPSLPMPAEYDTRLWPLDARVWLYKAALNNSDISKLGIYWNPRMHRVVIPVRDDLGNVIYWQARSLDKTNPRKYLNPAVDKRRLVARYGSGAAVVLTEDILSAYRVSRAAFEGWCLLGTKLNDHIATGLIKADRPVAVWLDPDKAGQESGPVITKQLRAYGLRAVNVVSEKDPKLLNRETIRWIVCERLGLLGAS